MGFKYTGFLVVRLHPQHETFVHCCPTFDNSP
jgi:hypothetical protein